MAIKKSMIGNIILNNLLIKNPNFLNKMCLLNLESIKKDISFIPFYNTSMNSMPKIQNKKLWGQINIGVNQTLYFTYFEKYIRGLFYFKNNFLTYNFVSSIQDIKLKPVLFRLRRINYINLITYFIIQTILNLQKKFFISNNYSDITIITLSQLSKKIYDFYKFNIDKSTLSRFVKNKFLFTPDNKIIDLKNLYANKKFVITTLLNKYFRYESKMILTNKFLTPASDKEIESVMKNKFNLTISRRQITNYRKFMGIPNKYNRTITDFYIPDNYKFAPFLDFSKDIVKNHITPQPGIYEIHLSNEVILYNNKPHTLIYIGSTKNLRIRLLSHLSKKDSALQKIISSKKCKFRIMNTNNYREFEYILLKKFILLYFNKPYCNKLLIKYTKGEKN